MTLSLIGENQYHNNFIISFEIIVHKPYHYEAPPGYNFDTYRSYDAIVDDPTSLSYNVAAKSTALVNYFKSQALHYKSNHLIHTFGSDFLWTDAKIFYKNLDKLIKYVNEHPEYNMQLKYSTPSEYIKAVNEQNHQFSLKQDDFFPYSDNPHAFWTGYFTSRVAIKGYVKRLGRQAQVYKKFLALMTYHNFIDYETATKSVESLDDALAICQHHDAVSGTEQQSKKGALDYSHFEILRKLFIFLKNLEIYEICKKTSLFSVTCK